MSEFPFEVTPEMQDLSELMGLREVASQAFPDSELRQVAIEVPHEVREDPLNVFIDQCFGRGRPQATIVDAIGELTCRGYTNLQAACYLIRMTMPAELNSLMARHQTTRGEIKRVIRQALDLLLSPTERYALQAGIMLGSYAALGITPSDPNFPGQLPLE